MKRKGHVSENVRPARSPHAHAKDAARALAASELRYRRLFESAKDGILILDAETGMVVDANPFLTNLLGFSRPEFLGKRIWELGFLKNLAANEEKFAELQAKEYVRYEDLPLETVDGQIREVEFVSNVYLAGGKRVIQCKIRDITERKRVEAKLSDQLHQAQKMEAVGRLAGGVAHDFNNLLMGIMGYAELCRKEIAPDHPIRPWLDEITQAAERSADITRQLLAFARKQIIAPKVLDLNDAAAGMLNLLQQMIGEDITLTWRPGPDLRPIKIDPSQVDQILANLCVNARDSIAGVGEIVLETGSVTLDATYCADHAEAIPGEYVYLSVSDNGHGMNKETLAQVFEPFFTTKELGKGTGLGLATVHGIVKQNNGFVYVYSEPGKGTTFKVYFPEVATETVETTATAKTEAPGGRGETVLLVEDDISVREMCGLFLGALGYRVMAAETPEKALQITAEHPGDLDVLLTDVVMPGMDGRQLSKRIGDIKPHIKTLFMSGYTADVIVQRGVLDKGVHFLSKPFTRGDLARRMREVIDSAPAVGGPGRVTPHRTNPVGHVFCTETEHSEKGSAVRMRR